GRGGGGVPAAGAGLRPGRARLAAGGADGDAGPVALAAVRGDDAPAGGAADRLAEEAVPGAAAQHRREADLGHRPADDLLRLVDDRRHAPGPELPTGLPGD